MDTSYFIYEEDTSIVIPYPNPSANGVETFLAPFQTHVCSAGTVKNTV